MKEKLEEMSLKELWRLFPIILTPHNPVWVKWAMEEISSLHSILDNSIVRINHIGSTAIKEICAKPIIDLLIETENSKKFDYIKSRLIASGYICMKESASRLDFNKGYTSAGYAKKVFHLHLRESGDNNEIYFRDYLNLHPEVAKEYESLKLSLWERYKYDRNGYTDAKTDFVTRVTSKALSCLDSQ